MASPELATIVETMRSRPPTADLTIEEQRAGFEMLASAAPPAEDIKREVWRGPYTTAGSQDSWGNEIAYNMPGAGENPFDLVSWGEDGKLGGEGFAADLTNHD